MSRRSLSVIDPALIDLDKKEANPAETTHQPMSLRIQMSSPFVSPPYNSHARLVDARDFDHPRRGQHSPPPITTLDSPPDRSSSNTPRRSPPMYYSAPPPQRQQQPLPHHFQQPPPSQQQPFYQQSFDTRYPPQDRYHAPGHQPPTQFVTSMPPIHDPYPRGAGGYGQQASQQQQPLTIVHTDDAATKLTEGIRRRCFNCCTTDTSTWRRSNLSPGKVLCNKCGLFERTHSRPRPDQFPHKRGPLAASTLRGRTPPGLTHPPSQSSQSSSHNHGPLPPIVSGGPGSGGGYQYHHATLTPLGGAEYQQHPSSHGAQGQGGPQGQQLPGLQSWHNTSSSSGHNTDNGTGQSQSGNNSASTSAHGTPLIPSRRSTLDSQTNGHSHHQSPRQSNGTITSTNGTNGTNGSSNNGNGATTTSSSAAPSPVPRPQRYDDGLSSNAASVSATSSGNVATKEEEGPVSVSGRTSGSGSGSGGVKGEEKDERDA